MFLFEIVEKELLFLLDFIRSARALALLGVVNCLRGLLEYLLFTLNSKGNP